MLSKAVNSMLLIPPFREISNYYKNVYMLKTNIVLFLALCGCFACNSTGFSESKKKLYVKDSGELSGIKLFGKVKSLLIEEEFPEEKKDGIIWKKTDSYSKKYTFNELGQEMSCATFKEDGSMLNKVTLKWSKNGSLDTKLLVRPNGEIIEKTEFQYDRNPNKRQENFTQNGKLTLIKKILQSNDTTLITLFSPPFKDVWIYRMIIQNNLVKNYYEGNIDKSGLKYYPDYSYENDNKGNLIKFILFLSNEDTMYVVKNKYNEYEDPIFKEFRGRNSLNEPKSAYQLTFEYDLDNHKNWTTQTTVVNGVKTARTVRKIEYF